MSTRLISHSEVDALLTCQAHHDFAYVGQLGGSALQPKTSIPLLEAGRAWGRAVAAWHELDPNLPVEDQLTRVTTEMFGSLEEDAEKQRETGVYLEEDHRAMEDRLVELLTHYIATAERLPIERPEHELLVAIPSRTGRRKSNRYKLQAFLDGIHVDDQGRFWLVEYKLRGRLSALEQIALSRQIRWYAWAWREATGQEPAGVIVDERLSEAPKPARWVKSKRKGEGIFEGTDDDGKEIWRSPSHAVDQLTTVALYEEACSKANLEPKPETVTELAARRWQLREPVQFRQGELDEVGEQLVSVAQQLRAFDAGDLFPLRNPKPQNCGGCRFREICPIPNETELVDALFERVPAKKDREAMPV